MSMRGSEQVSPASPVPVLAPLPEEMLLRDRVTTARVLAKTLNYDPSLSKSHWSVRLLFRPLLPVLFGVFQGIPGLSFFTGFEM